MEMQFKLNVEKDVFYELKELNEITNIPISSLEYWCRKGKLKSNKPGRSFIVKGEWLLNLFEGNWFNSKSKSKSIIRSPKDIKIKKEKLSKTIKKIKKKGLTISDLK